MADSPRHIHVGAFEIVLDTLMVLLGLMVLKLIAIHYNGHNAAQAFLTVV